MQIKIEQIQYSTHDNVVFCVHWRAVKTVFVETAKKNSGGDVIKDEFNAESWGAVKLDYKDPSSPDFVELENINNEMLLQWLELKLDKKKIKKDLDAKLDRQLKPQVQSISF